MATKTSERVKVILISKTSNGELHREGYVTPELARRLIAKGAAKSANDKPGGDGPAPAPEKPPKEGKK